MRDKLLLIANEKVIIKLLEFEDKGVGKTTDLRNKYLTELLKAIRKDLKLGYKSLPILCLKKEFILTDKIEVYKPNYPLL